MKKTFDILYDGSICSLNDYKSKHWATLRKKITPIKLYSKALIISEKIPKLNTVRIKVEYNNRLDVDNVVGTIKPFVDTLRDLCLKDDKKKYWSGLCIDYGVDIPKNCMLIRIEGEIDEHESNTEK